ncbi:MAG: hypothetical protein ABFE07_29020 [Armatimonadia bacterium]
MRCWQPYGLNAAAKKFLEENGFLEEIETSKCPHCGKTIASGLRLKHTIYINLERGFYESDAMEEWTLKDGRKARRVEDFCVWSSGPMTFDCLEIDGQKVCQWTPEEASAACGEEISGPDDGEELPEDVLDNDVN